MTPDQIAAAVNKPRSTIYRWRKENPDLYQAAADYAAGMRGQRDRLREALESVVDWCEFHDDSAEVIEARTALQASEESEK